MSNSNDSHVSLTDAKQRFGELVKRAAYGGETVVLEFHGKPIAAIVPYSQVSESATEMKMLRERGVAYSTGTDRWRMMDESLQRLDAIRERIARRQGGASLPDSVDLVREAREERDEQLDGLR